MNFVKKKISTYALIILVAAISIFPLLKQTNIYGHDSRFHVACISDIKENISLSNPIPKISSNIGNNLGYGTNLFYPPLPHYLCAYMQLGLEKIGFNISQTIAFCYLLVSIASGIAMFHLSFSITKNQNISIIASIIYLLMPYRIGNIIVRGALNESFVFVFFPIILISLNRLIENKKFLLLFIIGYAGLILSHLVLAFYSSIFIIIWGIFHLKKLLKKEIIKKILLGILIVSIIVLPSISLMLCQKAGANYVVFLDNFITDYVFLDSNFCKIKDFVIPKSDYSWEIPLFINIFVIISLFISFIYLIKKPEKLNSNTSYLILLLILCFTMCLKIFPWKLLSRNFFAIQFPWRLELFIAVCLSILAPLWLENLKFSKVCSIMFIVILIISEIPLLKSLSTYKYLYEGIDYASGLGNYWEYLTMNGYFNYEYLFSRGNDIRVNKNVQLNSKIFEIPEKLVFKLTNISNDSQVELPRLFYVGYKLTNSKNEEIAFYENEKGFIEFLGTNDIYTLEFTGPSIYIFCVTIRKIFFVLLILFGTYNLFTHKQKNVFKISHK